MIKKTIFLIFTLFIYGCGLPQQEPVVRVDPCEIDSHKLSCEECPEAVDGDLNTSGSMVFRCRETGEAIGNPELIIKMLEPMKIRFVEIHPDSKLSCVIVYIATRVHVNGDILFTIVNRDGIKIDGHSAKIRIPPSSENIKYVKITAAPIWDPSRPNIFRGFRPPYEKLIPVKAPLIREIKFYES